MTADKPTSVVPNLRFPEFRSAGDWHFQPLNDIAEPISERAGTSKCVPRSITTGVGLVSQEEKFGRTIAGDSYKNYIRLHTNDFAYNKSATKEFPQGYIARYSGTKDAAVPNSIFTCFRPD
jgi:type I restriction enzyme, S subunit